MSQQPSPAEPAELDDAVPGHFAAAFGEAVAERGLSLEQLRRRLQDRGTPVSAATLSFWRSGRRRPEGSASLAAVDVLEDVLGLPTGHLTDRLGRSRRPQPGGPRLSFSELSTRGPTIESALHRLGLDERGDHADQFTHRTLRISRRRGITAHVRILTRALRDGVISRPFITATREKADDLTELRILGGARRGRELHLHDEGLSITELVYDHPLDQGELGMVEYEIDFAYGALSGEFYELQLTGRVGEALLWARFERDDPPRSVTRYVEDGRGRIEDEVVGDRALSVLHLGRGVGPGRLGVSWSFDEPLDETAPVVTRLPVGLDGRD